MNNKIIKQLITLGIYDSRRITEEEYKEQSQKNTEESPYIYMVEENNGYNIYNKVDTKGLTPEEVELQLEIDRTKNVRSIKHMVCFFVILTVLSILYALYLWNQY